MVCCQVEIDRRMLDFCVGLDTEFSEVVEGSHLYFPKTKFEQVRIETGMHTFMNDNARTHTHTHTHTLHTYPCIYKHRNRFYSSFYKGNTE